MSDDRRLISEIETRLDEPTATGLAHAVSKAVRDKILAPADRMPPIRTLAHQLGMSPTTVSAAWAILTRAGTLVTAGRRGTMVADIPGSRSIRYHQVLDRETPFAHDLSTGVPDPSLLPNLGASLRSLTEAATPASYLDNPVLPQLRDVLLESWSYHPPALTLVDGAMDGIELVLRSALTFGDRVLVENPTFPPLLDLLEAAGMIVDAVPIDSEGLNPDKLTTALRRRPHAVFLQPRAHNPTGVSMTLGRMTALTEILRDADTLIVEDDSAAAICEAPDLSFGSVLPARTVHIRSYSKSHGPDLRIAAVSGPDEVIARIQHMRQLGQGWTSRLLQRLLLHLLKDAASVKQVERARSEYTRRRQVIAGRLRAAGIPTMGSDGLNLWVPVHDETAAVLRMAVHGIGVAPGSPFVVGKAPHPHIRVTSGLLTGAHDEVADLLVAAAQASPWPTGAR